MKLNELLEIINKEEDENRYGGYEDSDGGLIPSIADWDTMRNAIIKFAEEKEGEH